MLLEKNIIEDDETVTSTFFREVNSIILAVIFMVVGYIILQGAFPQISVNNLSSLIRKYVGVSWPFFFLVSIYLLYVTGAWVVEIFALG